MATEFEIRAAALRWLRTTTDGGTTPISRDMLANEFLVDGERFPLVDRGRGIRKPAGWTSALSILTAAPKAGRSKPYDDEEGPDGLHRYKFRRDEAGSAENQGLRNAMTTRSPLIWFVGVSAGWFQAIFPVHLIAEEAGLDQFVMALSDEQRFMYRGGTSPVEEDLRRYVLAETRRRLHQPVFASQVMTAYGTRCAVCSLGHRELLDAAHITPDTEAHGFAVVSNGLALCKIHHAAYDRNILGIRPDLVVQISERLLHEIDGPMLRYGLQERHDKELMTIPRRQNERPDKVRLEERWELFRNATA